MSKNLLFEIGVEEIPARFMKGSLESLCANAVKTFKENRLAFDDIRTMGTPRRLTLIINGLGEKQENLLAEVKGPAKKAAYDDNGNPTKALLGFARSQNVKVEDMFVKTVGKNEYLFAKKEEKGQDTAVILPELLESLVHNLRFPKPMRWGDNEMRFVRPIRWLVVLFGEEVIPVTIGGVTADRISQSHRFYGSGDVEITSPDTYVDQLRENYVMVDPAERRKVIVAQIKELEAKHNAVVPEDEDLLEEVVFLLEYPTALMGKFEDDYLRLPKEAIITPMREHQHYFPVLSKDGDLLPNFVTVRNGLPRNIEVVTAGNEKVLRARLADAAFFYDEDIKTPLENNIQRLKGIVFHITMGTEYEKVQRIQVLTNYLADICGVDNEDAVRGAYLAKADLLSNMVYEFPELQGVMGEYYSLAQGEKPIVAQSIREHYLPRFAGDELPKTLNGMIISIADKIDSVVGFFAMDMEPTGSQDPYALRRQAMGIVQIILHGKLAIDVDALASVAYDTLAASFEMKINKETTLKKVKEFFKQRLVNVLGEENLAYDSIAAVIDSEEGDFCRTYAKGLALEKFRTDENFPRLMAGFTRVHNLAKKSETTEFNPDAFVEAAEKELLAAYEKFVADSKKALADENYEGAFLAVAGLCDPIDKYLTDIMVMCDDEALKNTRLGFLAAISGAIIKVANFAEIVK